MCYKQASHLQLRLIEWKGEKRSDRQKAPGTPRCLHSPTFGAGFSIAQLSSASNSSSSFKFSF